MTAGSAVVLDGAPGTEYKVILNCGSSGSPYRALREYPALPAVMASCLEKQICL